MHASSKSSSSEDDLLLDSEISRATRRKHFLDYDYENQSPPTTSAIVGVASQSKASISCDNGNTINNHDEARSNNNAQQLVDPKKKISERPSTSKTATIELLNSGTRKANLPNNNNAESVYSILSILGQINSGDVMTSKLLEMSKNREMCAQLRLSGCMSLLVQIIHSDPVDEDQQTKCLKILHNIIHCHPDDKAGRREARVLRLIEQLFDFCNSLRSIQKNELSDGVDRHPIQAIGTLMKTSFDEDHRYAMCTLGALQTISTLIQLDHAVHGSSPADSSCITMRRYAGMCLTNLTFGDGNNKALLCSNKNFMRALVDQINSDQFELVPVSASVIRNLSWRADNNMKEVLSEIGAVRILTLAAMKCSQENTLKAILSALWNLSNHCAKNKAEFCEIDGSLEFLVDLLLYDAASRTTSVIENAGGILRNVSTHIAMHEDYRAILRRKNCFNILLHQLKSPSLTVVSSACGTLGNLSARCPEDQNFLRENGAIPMLRSLIYSKHKMISTGSTIALRHLLTCKSSVTSNDNLDSVAKMMDLKELPTLNVRKQRALEHELNISSESYKINDASPSSLKPSKVIRSSELKVQDIEDEDEDAPTNFSQFDDDHEGERSEYQETNLDQITDYSIRYAENQYDSEEEEEVQKPVNVQINSDDTTQCYNTEDTPHAVLSGATSTSDLRKEVLKESVVVDKKLDDDVELCQSPAEKTVNYCVEGTPGNFSRSDSFSDLEEGKLNLESDSPKALPQLKVRKEFSGDKESVSATPKSVTFGSIAGETPMMFSRTSSMGSLSSADPPFADDKSSVVSEFSRLQSGITSPFEIPDSPTQSVPQSPSRLNGRPQMKRRTPPLPRTREDVGAETTEDSTNAFHVENTPAAYSYATSLSNLSFDDEPKISTDAISKDFQLMKHPSSDDDDQKLKPTDESTSQPTGTAEHSDSESNDDDNLLESCINMGMNRVLKIGNDEDSRANISGSNPCNANEGMLKFSPQLVKENPLDMMRAGAPLLPPYRFFADELNKFVVEDSPCTFSLRSGLSEIVDESSIDSKPTAKVESKTRDDQAGPSKKHDFPPKTDFGDSLSSLSIESEDDGNLFSQTVAAGLKTQRQDDGPSAPINIPMKYRTPADMCNESASSLDSCGKDDASRSILEQCIMNGINKVVKKDSSKSRVVAASTKKSMLPTLSSKPGTSKAVKTEKRVQEKKDKELLQECITTGILRNTRSDLAQNLSHLSISESKNVKATSVIVTDNHQCARTIADVVAKGDESSNNDNKTKSVKADGTSYKRTESLDRDECIASGRETSRQASLMMQQNGSSKSFDMNFLLGSGEESILERSNEYPAAKLSMGNFGDFEDDSMEVSNEFMTDNENLAEAKIEDKHKDPDLMLKSVDRLTQELVSTAEYLRQNNAYTISDEISYEQKMSGSNNNTWNDDNSFPSISMSAPMIGSTNDEATIATDRIYPMPEETPNQLLDDKTPTNENYIFDTREDQIDGPPARIEFKVGGEIGTQPINRTSFVSFGPTSIETCSTMSNSTIVQVEAKRIANKLTSMTNRLMDSTNSLLDLENVRPPSSMDCISLNSFCDSSIQQSPMRQARKSLVTGLVAKRALGQTVFSGSIESMNSIHNIDSIRPPSMMDELLDSMISVDSIVSEIVDPTMMGLSNYETALDDDMDDSLTLRSCQDLTNDDAMTLTFSDFSSAESTPKKKRNSRASTPKQKRQADKDRYKTYTIQVDMLLKEQQEQMQGSSSNGSMKRSLNARQRRQEDRQRFETQIISSPPHESSRRKEEPERFKTFNLAAEADDDQSIRAMTENFKFIRNGVTLANAIVDTAGIRIKLNQIKSGGKITPQAEDSLEYERQNSETESQRDLKNSLNSSVENENSPASINSQPEQPKTKARNSYISPYRMTTRITPTKSKSVKVMKTPTIANVVNRNQGLELKSPNSASKKAKAATTKCIVNAIPSKNSKPVTTPTQPQETPAAPIRQGTFIQDEPTLENVPVVNDASPAKNLSSKLKPPTRVPSFSKIATIPTGKTSSPKKTSNLPASISQLKYRSNSNASMKSPIAAPVRSNTGITLNNPRKNVTSKIAGIWKNSEKKESLLKKPLSTSSTQLNSANKVLTPTGARVVKGVNKDSIKRSQTCEEICE